MSVGPLKGRVALITGGSKGIGRATALRLAHDGAFVVINYSSDATAADDLLKEIGTDRGLSIKADASDVTEIERMVNATVDRFGKIDILIANAGILLMKDLENTSEHDFDSTMATNVKGPYFLAQKAVPYMPPGSHVVFLSTTLCHASTVTPAYLLYCTTKGAIEQMTRVLAKDLAKKEISVNAIAPGPTGTDMFYKGKSEAVLKMVTGAIPRGRVGMPEEIADAIAFVSGNDSRWVTGQVIKVNGGMA